MSWNRVTRAAYGTVKRVDALLAVWRCLGRVCPSVWTTRGASGRLLLRVVWRPGGRKRVQSAFFRIPRGVVQRGGADA